MIQYKVLIVFFCLCLQAGVALCAAAPQSDPDTVASANASDTIDLNNPPEDFVTASLVVADPGDVLYSRVGHVAIRMQCPYHQLDYVFSYEAEDVRGQVLRFLAGNLKMGLFAIPIQNYLQTYISEGRGVKEYTLNLPVKVKQNLWRVLDNHVMEGINLPYDYITHGCAHSALMMLKEGLDTIPIQYGPWPEKYEKFTRRELTEQQMSANSPWTWAFLNLIGNGAIDHNCPNEEKVIMPTDLVEVLQSATVQGQPLLSPSPTQLLPSHHQLHASWFKPWMAALMLLLLTVVCLLLRSNLMTYLLLGLQTLLGLITCYLVFFSTLCCTEWSWLIIPFNPLPAICWKWRHYWARPYAVVLLFWLIVMICWPHSLTDWSYVLLTAAIAVSLYDSIRINNTKLDFLNK